MSRTIRQRIKEIKKCVKEREVNEYREFLLSNADVLEQLSQGIEWAFTWAEHSERTIEISLIQYFSSSIFAAPETAKSIVRNVEMYLESQGLSVYSSNPATINVTYFG